LLHLVLFIFNRNLLFSCVRQLLINEYDDDDDDDDAKS